MEASAKAMVLIDSLATSVTARAACICFCAIRPAKSLSKKVTACPSVQRCRRERTRGRTFGCTTMEFDAAESPKASGRSTTRKTAKPRYSGQFCTRMAAASAPEGENVFNVVFRRSRFNAEERAAYDHARETIRFLELEHVIDVPAGNLSGGQKKLVELGRALMRDPKIILLDEIGAGINRTLLAKLADKIKLLNIEQGLTFCLIEHDLDYVSRLCDHVLVMAQGKLLTEGTVNEVRNDERVIEAYFGGGKYEAHA